MTRAMNPKSPDKMTTLEKALQKLIQKDNELSEKDHEIIKLKNKLKENNIEVD